MSSKLSPQEQQLYDYVAGQPDGTDVPIRDMWSVLYRQEVACITSPRKMQQRVGAVVHRINVKLEGTFRIEPGVTKRTYRAVRPE